MKNLSVVIAVGALFLLAWAWITGRLQNLMPAAAGTTAPLVTEKESSIATNTPTQGNITTNVTTGQSNPVNTGPVTKYVPTKVGRILRNTTATKSGATVALTAGTQIAVYGTDGKGNYTTSKGFVPVADILITGILPTNGNTTGAGTGSNSAFNLKVVRKSSIQA